MANKEWSDLRVEIVKRIKEYKAGKLALTTSQQTAMWKAFSEIEHACKHPQLVHVHYGVDYTDEYSSWHHQDECEIRCLYSKVFYHTRYIEQAKQYTHGITCLLDKTKYVKANKEVAWLLAPDKKTQLHEVVWDDELEMYITKGKTIVPPPVIIPPPEYITRAEDFLATLEN